MTRWERLSGHRGRVLGSVVYFALARHLPWSPRPGGAAGQRLRRWCASLMLDRCGDQVNVEHGAFFGSGRDIELGDRSDIGMDALLIGPVTIGSDVMMGPRCVLLAANHETTSTAVPMNQQGFAEDRRIVIGDDVWLGAGVTVTAGRRIEQGSIVAAGSVVVSDIPAWSVAAGNPAVVKRDRRSPRPPTRAVEP